MDRNPSLSANDTNCIVALHPEGVDRNLSHFSGGHPRGVALHPEGVDRNLLLSYIRLDKLASPSTRRAWIEILRSVPLLRPHGSPSTRRAWIEIRTKPSPRKKCVVALHPEGVDRNIVEAIQQCELCTVALHPEGVDRNVKPFRQRHTHIPSPSTRRAWIEIHQVSNRFFATCVALHPEGVDRNTMALLTFLTFSVALHPEGVDRNSVRKCYRVYPWCRPPPGGRG